MSDENILKLANDTSKHRGPGKRPDDTPKGVLRPVRQPPSD